MAFIHWRDDAHWRVEAHPRQASEWERFLCVAAVCALAAAPLAVCAALTIWGS